MLQVRIVRFLCVILLHPGRKFRNVGLFLGCHNFWSKFYNGFYEICFDFFLWWRNNRYIYSTYNSSLRYISELRWFLVLKKLFFVIKTEEWIYYYLPIDYIGINEKKNYLSPMPLHAPPPMRSQEGIGD